MEPALISRAVKFVAVHLNQKQGENETRVKIRKLVKEWLVARCAVSVFRARWLSDRLNNPARQPESGGKSNPQVKRRVLHQHDVLLALSANNRKRTARTHPAGFATQKETSLLKKRKRKIERNVQVPKGSALKLKNLEAKNDDAKVTCSDRAMTRTTLPYCSSP